MAISNSLVTEDNAYGTLASGLAVSDLSLSFTTGHGARFPAVAAGQVLYCCLLNSNNVLEEIKITAHTAAADTATIVRGVNGTTAKAWSAGDRIEARLSSEALTHLQQEALKGVTLTTGDSGATYTGTMTATHLGYVNGMIYCFLAATTNSGAAPTINIDSLGAKPVVADDNSALVASQMPVNGLYRYDDTSFRLLNQSLLVATQAQMEAATSVITTVTPGRVKYNPGVAKAWVNYSGDTSTINASHNVTSVTNNGTGDYTVNFTTAFSSANYCVAYTFKGSVVTARPLILCVISQLAASCQVNVGISGDSQQSGSLSDAYPVQIVFFGDQ